MKDKYIPELIMSVIWKNHGNDNHNFMTKDNIDYASTKEDTASERDALVNKINEISKEFNTK